MATGVCTGCAAGTYSNDTGRPDPCNACAAGSYSSQVRRIQLIWRELQLSYRGAKGGLQLSISG